VVEGKHVVVQHRHRSLGLLGDVQEAEGIGAKVSTTACR
jgi:hypothetical protein